MIKHTRRLRILLPAVCAGLTAALVAAGSAGAALAYQPGPLPTVVSMDQLRAGWAAAEAALTPPRVAVKGIYLTASSAANSAKLSNLLGLIDRTELNAIVVNVKDDWGNITYNTDQATAWAAGAINPDLSDLQAFTGQLKAKQIYSIARIVTFKDSFVPKARPDLAVARRGGGIWRDYNGVPWLNPYNREAWEYIVDIARDAAVAGFDEIQFDYVRFPTDGDLSSIIYPGMDDRPKAQVIADFLAYARKELHPYGVWVSADAFGLVTSVSDDMGIGQRLEEMSRSVDYLSPMVYPSHYIPGNLGLENPNAMPYQTVYRSMLDTKSRWEKAGLTEQVRMRPWLQDFSWGHPYGAKEVRDQIQATYDAGYQEWLLWNAANVYTEAALLPEGEN